jgi:hypothetical protein
VKGPLRGAALDDRVAELIGMEPLTLKRGTRVWQFKTGGQISRKNWTPSIDVGWAIVACEVARGAGLIRFWSLSHDHALIAFDPNWAPWVERGNDLALALSRALVAALEARS